MIRTGFFGANAFRAKLRQNYRAYGRVPGPINGFQVAPRKDILSDNRAMPGKAIAAVLNTYNLLTGNYL
ncbi:MAG: hypothetical protein ACFCUM_06030 [Bacteroidales bacterium]